MTNARALRCAGVIGFFNNPAAALVDDGRLVAMAEEERLVRYKGAHGFAPVRALGYCLHEGAAALADIDEISWALDARFFRWRMPLYSAGLWLRYLLYPAADHGRELNTTSAPTAGYLATLLQQQPALLRHSFTRELRLAGFGGRLPDIHFYNHHQSHAAAAFYTSGWERAVVLVIDGMGEDLSSSVWLGEGQHLARRAVHRFPDSLGEFYAAFTEYLGFRPYSDEGKLMGLAAYGKWDAALAEKFARVIDFPRDRAYRVNPRYTVMGAHAHGTRFTDALVDLFGPSRRVGEVPTTEEQDLAYMAQTLLEKAVLRLVREAVDLTGCRRVCLAGGVAMNCRLNGRVADLPEVEDLWVMPASNDAGAALGAAMLGTVRRGGDPRFRMTHAGYGPEYQPAAIRAALERARLPFTEPADLAGSVAALLAAGKTVGWFQGRMEIGARALGCRSILAHPGTSAMRDHLNAAVKGREPWRPLAPSVLAEESGCWFRRGGPAPFMIVADEVRPEQRARVPAVVHVDGSARPQTVHRDVQPLYHALIEQFARRTGLPLLLNTSFNGRGEPIVCSPEDAVRCFVATGPDLLAIGPYLAGGGGNGER